MNEPTEWPGEWTSVVLMTAAVVMLWPLALLAAWQAWPEHFDKPTSREEAAVRSTT